MDSVEQSEEFNVLSQLQRLSNSNRRIKQILHWNTVKLDHLQIALGKLNSGKSAYKRLDICSCSSGEHLHSVSMSTKLS